MYNTKTSETVSRRRFLKQTSKVLAATLAAGEIGSSYAQQPFAEKNFKKENDLIWGNLIHLGYNMWSDRKVDSWGGKKHLRPHILKNVHAHDHLRCDQKLWDDIAQQMAAAGMNMIVIDLGEGIQYPSHPELSVKGSWSPAKLKSELDKLRALGLEPIPKLNFAAGHDIWLGEYSRQVSTPAYYKVCKELISDVCELFDKPRFFHLGYDEETAAHQKKYLYTVVRQFELWWHDFNFFVEAVERNGVRPWIWSDHVWNHTEEFYKIMPKSVLQSNWYYGNSFDKFDAGELSRDDTSYIKIQTYIDLEKHGYDQIPTASNWSRAENFAELVKFCKKHISPRHLKGFLQTPWVPTLEVFREHHMEAINAVGHAIAKND